MKEFQNQVKYAVKASAPDREAIRNAVKEERSHRAIAIAEQMTAAYRAAMVGSTVPVLFEEPSDGLFTGHAPNYVRVYAPGNDLHNELRNVRITGIYRDGVLGEIVES